MNLSPLPGKAAGHHPRDPLLPLFEVLLGQEFDVDVGGVGVKAVWMDPFTSSHTVLSKVQLKGAVPDLGHGVGLESVRDHRNRA